MERAMEVAVVSRGKEPLIKRVWYGVGKSQSPEAWGNRILNVIDSQIVPRLSPEQQQWAAAHQEPIRDAAMYAGVGITTAEIVGGVMALEKLTHLRERLFGFPMSRVAPIEQIARQIRVDVLDPIGILTKSVDHMPKGIMDYLRHVITAGERSGLDSFGQFGLAATLLTIITNKGNPEYAPLFAEIAGIAGKNDYQALQPGIRKLFERAYEETAERFRFDPRAVKSSALYDHWMNEDAPGAKRVLQISGVPIGRAKHLVGLMRTSLRPSGSALPDIDYQSVNPAELPGFNFVLKKMLATPPPIGVYNEMRDAVRILSRDGGQVSKEQRLRIARHIAATWVDHAMPNFMKRPEARQAFLAQLEREGYPGMPRPTTQSLQEYLSQEYLPVSRSLRVLDSLSADLPKVFDGSHVVARHRPPRITVSKSHNTHQNVSISPVGIEQETPQQAASREQSRRQLEQNAYIRELTSAVRKIKREERSRIVKAIEERLRPERERLEKISAIHTIARETPSRVKAVVKRIEAFRARIKLRKELKKKADAAKAVKQA